LAQVHSGGVVVSARGGGVDTDQGQVHLASLRCFRDQALQQGLENALVTPLPEAVVHSGPGAELLRYLPPLPAGLEPPDHALELPPQPLGIRAVLADLHVPPDELPFLVSQLHSRHARGSSIPRVSHCLRRTGFGVLNGPRSGAGPGLPGLPGRGTASQGPGCGPSSL
jgi:hypothetical protein